MRSTNYCGDPARLGDSYYHATDFLNFRATSEGDGRVGFSIRRTFGLLGKREGKTQRAAVECTADEALDLANELIRWGHEAKNLASDHLANGDEPESWGR